ncbi:MAG: response regulator [Deltaproteobacteria bacterium]|nr:response regulator [Deltaproteobacteria bacterium]
MPSTILCVQEDRALAREFAAALEADGHEVLFATDGRRCLEIVERQTPDLVVLDVYLSRQDGFEVLAELRQRPVGRTLPVLLHSARAVTRELAGRAERLAANGIVASPVTPDQLAQRVAGILQKGDARPEASLRTPPLGTLRELPVPELMRAIHQDELDGVLLLDHGRKKKAIEFRGGWPVSVRSNLVSECLGNHLVEKGLVTQTQLDESLERMRTGEGLQGEILVAMEVMDEEAVVDAIEGHALQKFLEIFSWRDGRFEVRRGAHVEKGSAIGLEGHPSKLIVDGVRHRYPLKQIDRYFAAHRDAFLVPHGDVQAQLDDLTLSGPEIAWLQGIDGATRIGTLEQSAEAIRRLAFALLCIDALAVEGQAGDREASRAAMGPVPNGARSSERSAGEEKLRVELATLANAMQNKNYYEILGVARSASDDEIRAAYAVLAKRTHPDRFHGASSSVRHLAAQVFARLSQAYDSVGCAEAREAYAAQVSHGRREAEAVDEGRRALQAETEFQRGEALLAQRAYESALICFGRAMENFPSEGEYHSYYGWCLHLCHPDNQIMLGEALEHCREGVNLAKDREKPYLLLGRLYKAMGKPGAAKKMFSRAVEIKPQCVEAMRELRIMNMRRDKDKGVLKRIFRR